MRKIYSIILCSLFIFIGFSTNANLDTQMTNIFETKTNLSIKKQKQIQTELIKYFANFEKQYENKKPDIEYKQLEEINKNISLALETNPNEFNKYILEYFNYLIKNKQKILEKQINKEKERIKEEEAKQKVECYTGYEPVGDKCLEICLEGSHREENQTCVQNKKECDGINGKGYFYWVDGKRTESCKLEKCNPGYFLLSGECSEITNITIDVVQTNYKKPNREYQKYFDMIISTKDEAELEISELMFENPNYINARDVQLYINGDLVSNSETFDFTNIKFTVSKDKPANINLFLSYYRDSDVDKLDLRLFNLFATDKRTNNKYQLKDLNINYDIKKGN